MSTRQEFVRLATAQGANIRALCRGFGISPQTAYTLLARFKEHGEEGLKERSRKPLSSPRRSSAELEARVLELHDKYPCWGARKLAALLPKDSIKPHPNTISAILRRHGREILPSTDGGAPANKRFEHDAPNLLWQMDFKGHFALTNPSAGRCYPLTVLDDHSRFSVCLKACSGETGGAVKRALIETFKLYGLPERITCDNGNPWGTSKQNGLTKIEVWLMRVGVRVSHSRPMHPQTQGKDERFHRTLKRELLGRTGFNSITACQQALDVWRDQYNLIRPHQALNQEPPVSRYKASGRPYPEHLPAIEYDSGDKVRKVTGNGCITYLSRQYFVGEGLVSERVAVRPGNCDGHFYIVFCNRTIGEIDLTINQ